VHILTLFWAQSSTHKEENKGSPDCNVKKYKGHKAGGNTSQCSRAGPSNHSDAHLCQSCRAHGVVAKRLETRPCLSDCIPHLVPGRVPGHVEGDAALKQPVTHGNLRCIMLQHGGVGRDLCLRACIATSCTGPALLAACWREPPPRPHHHHHLHLGFDLFFCFFFTFLFFPGTQLGHYTCKSP